MLGVGRMYEGIIMIINWWKIEGGWSEKEVGEKLKKGCWFMVWEKGLLGRIFFVVLVINLFIKVGGWLLVLISFF